MDGWIDCYKKVNKDNKNKATSEKESTANAQSFIAVKKKPNLELFEDRLLAFFSDREINVHDLSVASKS